MPHYDVKVVVMPFYEIKVETPSNLLDSHSDLLLVRTISIHIQPNCSVQCDHWESPVSFLLLGVHGKVSDKHMTVNTGFLNLLLLGNIVLSHSIFDIEEDVPKMLAFLR